VENFYGKEVGMKLKTHGGTVRLWLVLPDVLGKLWKE